MLLKIQPPLTEQEQLNRYYQGLNLEVAKQLSLMDPTTLQDAMCVADRMDQRL